MAKKGHKIQEDEEEEDVCLWCRPINASLKAEFEREVPELVNYPDNPHPRDWISCTRCKTWYHTDCVVLAELVLPVRFDSAKSDRTDVEALFPTPGSSGSLPSEVDTRRTVPVELFHEHEVRCTHT
jgi:hypothetical protein